MVSSLGDRSSMVSSQRQDAQVSFEPGKIGGWSHIAHLRYVQDHSLEGRDACQDALRCICLLVASHCGTLLPLPEVSMGCIP